MESTGPATYRLLLGRDLKELREGAGINREDAANHVGWHLSKISKVEQGQATLKADEVTRLLEFYGARPEDTARVEEFAAHARKRGSFGKVADWARQYLGLEADARSLAIWDTELIPGLFQTRGYAKAVVTTSAVVAAVDVSRVVDSRVRRQALLDRMPPPEVHLVLGEAALRRMIGDPATMAGQLRYLAEVSTRPNITVQVHPFAAGQHAALGSGFTLLDVAVGTATKTWAYLEDLTRADLLDGESHVNAYQLAFRTLTETALPARESIAMLEAVAKDLEKK
ncbi:helix-turn-helix domain-containing protein [Amycolatopsis sp. H20-H5]|uniref:helix-turn-helix domain-containing protein n=1 Tax=Amycolatopsis sp. H20-H5 TaxID=3046309 RepID=UPI002DB9C8A9|nr:helix-turn-helix transcriptional regulator [Amycolatopsis sp. H20-H5]MEC3975069.1 helix-turn-helix transcriptional regulator [Amycolatopsis sp. H20-H5]